ncbi:DUF6893 family small protein [Streptosporangium sandarakinum]|uniref:Uncharacterized protein n=1 Tax=Streptosporangium sandarakinum TaxID=1260955 RepID=A0A852URN0_9ACTN|nr:hypothetical protein [Streptosporangium sandarakinum]
MLRRLFVGAVLVGIGVLVYQSIPDLKRYMRIRRM